jgi:hypothetical protein
MKICFDSTPHLVYIQLGHFKTFFMKKIYFLSIIACLVLSYVSNTYADSTEQVRVIRPDKTYNDLVIERTTGERLLIQHSPICNSMNTEFPVYLLWNEDKLTKLKVASNEICNIYNYTVYAGDMTVSKRIKSDNLLVKEHLAEAVFGGAKYEIDYGTGCENIRDFEGKIVYTDKNPDLAGARMYLPADRGSCDIKSARLLENAEEQNAIESPIKNLQYKAENNETYFYWDKDTSETKWIYLISHSRFDINPADYPWDRMPLLKTTIDNSYTVKSLANNMKYYFYISARNENGEVAPWTEVSLTPIKTAFVFENNPDPEEFQIDMKEDTDTAYILSWPYKGENSKRYILQFYVNGKRELYRIISGELSEYTVTKKPEYKNSTFRLTLRSVPKVSTGVRYSDGIYWEDKTE